MSDPDGDKLRDRAARALERCVRFKELLVAEHGPDGPMPFLVEGYRGDTHIATLYPQGRDKMLWAVGMAMGGFGCDIVAGTVHAYYAAGEHHRANPMTGQPWKAGEMAKAYQAGYRDVVKEGLSTHAVDKVTGKLAGAHRDYRVKHRKVRWQPVTGPFVVGEDDFTAIGLVPDAFREAMVRPDIQALTNRLAGDAAVFDLTPKQARAHVDVVCLRFCAKLDIPVAYNGRDEETVAIIEGSLGDEERNAEFGVGVHLQRLGEEGP